MYLVLGLGLNWEDWNGWVNQTWAESETSTSKMVPLPHVDVGHFRGDNGKAGFR